MSSFILSLSVKMLYSIGVCLLKPLPKHVVNKCVSILPYMHSQPYGNFSMKLLLGKLLFVCRNYVCHHSSTNA